ncbi:MAG: D-glycero-alpha-D-manno-heptose-1,7-bisphosphate 7-phosphatase [Bdellovibrio sp.]|jgi:D-glycero-D-manno-heptose 1,7-bisphosphate phosphatase
MIQRLTPQLRPALFFDRDGVIIHDAGYLKDAGVVRLIPGAAELIKRANQAGVAVVVVTNQSGIGRTWITLENYKSVSLRMIELLEKAGAKLDRIFFAPFFKTAEQSPYAAPEFEFETRGVKQKGLWDDHFRKPNPGMLLAAASALGLDLPGSVMIGDRITDLAAAHHAGLSKFYFLNSDLMAEEIKDLAGWLAKLDRHKAGHFQYVMINTLDEVIVPKVGTV